MITRRGLLATSATGLAALAIGGIGAAHAAPARPLPRGEDDQRAFDALFRPDTDTVEVEQARCYYDRWGRLICRRRRPRRVCWWNGWQTVCVWR